MSRTAWFHCFAGTAGDMSMAALVHAGADPGAVADLLGGLPLDGWALSFEPVLRGGIASTQAHVAVLGDDHEHDDESGHQHAHDDAYGHDHHRAYRHIRQLLDDADLPARVRDRAQRTFRLLAEVEGAMHRMPVDDVEFHEVGSVDAIIDIVGVCAALEVLEVGRVVCSGIAVGTGTVKAAHGLLPNPAPAVVELLARRSAPSHGIADHRELATPTGVALMCALADEFAPMPSMQVTSIGYGAGASDIPGRPNVVQVVIGTESTSARSAGQAVQLLETNVDDISGEVVAHTIAQLMASGAHDAWATPIVMKKGRPAYTLHVLCDPVAADALRTVLLSETGSMGVRGALLERWPEARTEVTVHVDGQPVRLKVSEHRVKVEFDDAAAAASALGLPVREVMQRAAALAP